MDLIRRKMLPVYAQTIFELKVNGGWQPIPPASILRAVITAWNPDGIAADEHDNLARDIHLKGVLDAAGMKAYRARGRHEKWIEEGWLIGPTNRGYVLDLLGQYRQLAALVLDGRQRELLWNDGRRTLL